MGATYYLGVSFLKGGIQIAEIQHKRKKLKVTVLAERPASIDLENTGASLSADHPQLSRFAKELKDILKQSEISAEYISFAIPPSPVFINIIPVDPSLSGKELKSYLNWEIGQYFPDESPNAFITDSQVLTDERTGIQQSFVVAVRRGTVAFLQKVSAMLGMKLHIVDVDQFSTEKTLIVNYPEILDHDIVLLGLRKNSIDASLIHNGTMVDYRTFLHDGEANPDKHVMDYLNYLKQKIRKTPEAMLLHGENIDKSFITTIRSETGIKQTLPLNVFRKLKAVDDLNPPLLKESYRFAAAIGLALRAK